MNPNKSQEEIDAGKYVNDLIEKASKQSQFEDGEEEEEEEEEEEDAAM